MKVTQYIARFLKDKGIHTVFELQGGMITRIIDALNQGGGYKHSEYASRTSCCNGSRRLWQN